MLVQNAKKEDKGKQGDNKKTVKYLMKLNSFI